MMSPKTGMGTLSPVCEVGRGAGVCHVQSLRSAAEVQLRGGPHLWRIQERNGLSRTWLRIQNLRISTVTSRSSSGFSCGTEFIADLKASGRDVANADRMLASIQNTLWDLIGRRKPLLEQPAKLK